ncbi:DUF4394 domain-containing protein [Hymenobacter sp. B1770]|uniref:DUF4394 domain-containing protein n=1 Tax=Hymenobacter sp. B1770 TaxID=1718788 RepID=UPI003CF718CE
MKIPLLFAFLLLAAPSFAQTIYGLGIITGSNLRRAPLNSLGLITIDPTTGASNTLAPVAISGITTGQILIGIDFRPANKVLYALGYDGATTGNNAQLYTLSPVTNAVTKVGNPLRLELGNSTNRMGFEFNPLADHIRVTSTNGANYRLASATGALLAKDSPLAYAGESPAAPAVSAVAYTNSYAGSRATTLYALDYRNGLLSVLSSPDGGTLTAPVAMSVIVSSGTYGIGEPDAMGLDIYFNPTSRENIGYLTEVTALRNGGRSSNLYRLNLTTGAATLLGNTVPAVYNFEIRDVAVALPTVVPLPVELVRFQVMAAPGTVTLDWATATEHNSAYFRVERSLDGVVFNAIGQELPAAGNSFARHEYALVDKALPRGASLLYYRLHQVDRDGSFSYSPVQAVVLVSESVAMSVFPNPAQASAVLVGAPSGAAVQVMDAVGRTVATAVVDETGAAQLRLPTGLARGMYLVRAGTKALRLQVE